jgi:F0F1-type ATP synthase epsilon subunit
MDDQSKGLTQRWVAYGFMNMVSDALEFFAAHANWKDFLEDRRAQCAAATKHFEDSQREHMAMMTRKSAEARRAKKLAKGVSA